MADDEGAHQSASELAPVIPDYLASPNAVLGDEGVQWRYGKPPDYSKTRKVWEDTKKMSHAAGSLPQLVENLVKNWEIEASFKPRLQDWRTIDHKNYTFAINGGPPQSAEHMIKVGTYNGIISPNEYYSPENSDFASSHKTFKRMMPTFAWEVIEVYSGPPRVAFKWRHWGVMKNDYVGFNNKGEKVVAKAHGGPIEIFGVTVAQVDDEVRLQAVDTWFDPLDMFRQIAPSGIVNKQTMNHKVNLEMALDVDANYDPPTTIQPVAQPIVPSCDGVQMAQDSSHSDTHDLPAPEEVVLQHLSNGTGEPVDAFVPHQEAGAQQPETDNKMDQSVAQCPADTAAMQGAHVDIEKTGGNFQEAHAESLAEPVTSTQCITTEVMDVDPNGAGPVDVEPTNSIYSSTVFGQADAGLRAGQNDNLVEDQKLHGAHDTIDKHLEGSPEKVHPHPHDMEDAVKPEPGEAVAAPAETEETRMTHEEMSRIALVECPFLMNRE